jgi:hypothetical protein
VSVISRKRQSDFRNWYDLPDGVAYGLLDDDAGPFDLAGETWTQIMTGEIPVIATTDASPKGDGK